MTATRKPNPTAEFTKVFVQEFLGEDFDFRAHARYMKEMKNFVNPAGDEMPIPGEYVLGCLRALRAGLFGFEGQINSVWCITYGDPPYFKQFAEWMQSPPSWYEPHLVELWERITGKIAYPELAKSAIIGVLPAKSR